MNSTQSSFNFVQFNLTWIQSVIVCLDNKVLNLWSDVIFRRASWCAECPLRLQPAVEQLHVDAHPVRSGFILINRATCYTAKRCCSCGFSRRLRSPRRGVSLTWKRGLAQVFPHCRTETGSKSREERLSRGWKHKTGCPRPESWWKVKNTWGFWGKNRPRRRPLAG